MKRIEITLSDEHFRLLQAYTAQHNRRVMRLVGERIEMTTALTPQEIATSIILSELLRPGAIEPEAAHAR